MKSKSSPGRGAPGSPAAPAPRPAQANTTDPQSRIMKSVLGWVQGYNAQAAVNERQLVVAAEVTQEGNDVATGSTGPPRTTSARPPTPLLAPASSTTTPASTWPATPGVAARWPPPTGCRFVIPVSTIHAGYNPRYFGRKRGSTLYTWMADTHASFHQSLISGTQGQPLCLGWAHGQPDRRAPRHRVHRHRLRLGDRLRPGLDARLPLRPPPGRPGRSPPLANRPRCRCLRRRTQEGVLLPPLPGPPASQLPPCPAPFRECDDRYRLLGVIADVAQPVTMRPLPSTGRPARSLWAAPSTPPPPPARSQSAHRLGRPRAR